MSILTDYYKFARISTKTKTRLDCVASTGNYPELEEKRARKEIRASERMDATPVGSLVAYLTIVPDHFGGNVHAKADRTLTMGSKNVSSIYVPDARMNYGFGDFKGTADALLFIFHDVAIVDGALQSGGTLEVFIARGKSRDKMNLYNLLADGVLDDELNELRGRATPEKRAV